MADITVASDPSVNNYEQNTDGNLVVWTDFRTGYMFYTDSSAPDRVVYTKTSDGGNTWAATVAVSGGVPEPGEAIGIWYDRWTPGDTGTLIHIAFADNNSAHDIVWRSLDTATDTLAAQVVVFAGGGSADAGQIVITKARGGNLYIGWHSNDANLSFGEWRRSTDNGTSWADPGDNPMENSTDNALFMPATGTGDDEDIWIIFWDDNVEVLSRKTWDDSAGTITETTFGGNDYANTSNWSATVRHSDGDIFLIVWDHGSGVSGDFECWQINGTTITQRTNILTAQTNDFQAGIMLDQNTGRLYAAWLGAASVGVVNFKTSDDGGVTWSGTTQFSAGTHSLRNVSAGISIRLGDTGRFMPIWFDTSPDDFETNDSNDVELPAVRNAVGDYWIMDSAEVRPTSSAQSALLKESDTRDTYFYDGAAWQLFSRWNGAKGSDVSSGATITLNEDSTYFDITGAVNIDFITIGDWEPGDEFTLQFDGAPTVNHNTGAPAAGTAAILLSGSANFVASANDTLTLIWDGSTFREKSRTVI